MIRSPLKNGYQNTVFLKEKLYTTNLSVISKESSAQLDPIKDTKWFEGSSPENQGKITPQMTPRTPLNFLE
jgi:hypothetical protein